MTTCLQAGRCAGSLLLAALVATCSAPVPILLQGNANSVEVGYSGNLAAAARVARRDCARYQRVPRFQGADLDTADFACVKP